MFCRSCGRSTLPGSRPFARSPTRSMPAEFARRAVVNGIPAQSTIFLPASLAANPECAVRPRFQSAVMITRFACSFNVLGRGPTRHCRQIGAATKACPGARNLRLPVTEQLAATEWGIRVPQGSSSDRNRTNSKRWVRVDRHKARSRSRNHSHHNRERLLAPLRVVQGPCRYIIVSSS